MFKKNLKKLLCSALVIGAAMLPVHVGFSAENAGQPHYFPQFEIPIEYQNHQFIQYSLNVIANNSWALPLDVIPTIEHEQYYMYMRTVQTAYMANEKWPPIQAEALANHEAHILDTMYLLKMSQH